MGPGEAWFCKENIMADKAWKAMERRFAKRMGTVRIGPTGDDGVDFITDDFAVQCKLRKTLPKWMFDALDNAVKGAGDERIGFALLKKLYANDDDAIVLIRFEDFEKLFDTRKDSK